MYLKICITGLISFLGTNRKGKRPKKLIMVSSSLLFNLLRKSNYKQSISVKNVKIQFSIKQMKSAHVGTFFYCISLDFY